MYRLLFVPAFLHEPTIVSFLSDSLSLSICVISSSFSASVQMLCLHVVLGVILGSGFYVCNRGEVILIRGSQLSKVVIFRMRFG